MEIGRSQGQYGVASPTVAARSGSYKPASGGGSRTVVVVPDDIAKLLPKDSGADVKPQQVEKMRAIVKKRYGEAVANTAFREINYRQAKVKRGIKGFIGQTSAKAIKGHHLTTATLRALEMASPNVGARAVKQRSETILAKLEPRAAELRRTLKDKQDELRRIYAEYVPESHTFIDAGPLRSEIAKLEGQINDLDQAIDEAKKDLQSATQTITDYQNNPLHATAFGKAQQALAKVDDDPEFHSLLNNTYARGEALHGGSGTAHRIKPVGDTGTAMAKDVAVTAGKNLVGIALPPVAVGMAWYSAIPAEDRQRRLGSAAKFLDDHPLARTMAKSMEAGAEVAKNKAAIAGTASFVLMGATAHFAGVGIPALKAVANPITGAIGSAVSNAALGGHMSQIGAQALSTLSGDAAGRVLGEVQNRTLTSLAPGSSGTTKTMARPEEIPLPEGTVPPTVPVKIKTDGGDRIKEFDMGKAGPALLHYLGPRVGDTSDPQEQNRKELRDLLGARPEDDFVPGRKVPAEERELDEKVARALDNPDAKGAAGLIRSVSPLRLLHIAEGWR
jgi:flagellar biosynthesis chaperone FliJ